MCVQVAGDSEPEYFLSQASPADDRDAPVSPRFVLFVDDANKSVVLAIRGTMSLDDVLTDVVSPNVKIPNNESPK